MITNVQAAFEDIRNNSDNKIHNLYSKTNSMAERVCKTPNTNTRTVGRQNLRNNVVLDTPGDYWRRVVYFTFYRLRKKQLSDRFQGEVASAFRAVNIMPNNLEQCKAEDKVLVLEYCNEDFSSPSTFQQELKLWKRYWANENDKSKSLSQTISVMKNK